MPRLPRISGDDAVSAFQKAGWRVYRISGSHHLMASDTSDNRLSIPVHAGKTIGKGLLRSQIKAAGLTIAQFVDLL